MAGGQLQLIATGSQDIPLIGSPQITFYKLVYRRHTNFAQECIQQEFNGTADWGRTITCQLARNADLVKEMYLQIQLPQVTAAVPTFTATQATLADALITYTAADHGLVTGDIVTIVGFATAAFNRPTPVSVTYASPTTFTVPEPGAIGTTTGSGTVTLVSSARAHLITTIIGASGTIYTTASPHNFLIGDIVSVTGFTTTAFNFTAQRITAVTANTFTVATAGGAGPSTAGATKVASMANYFGYVPYLGEKLIDSISVSIGGQTIDSQVGEWIHIWNQLTLPESKKQAYYEGIGHVPSLVAPASFTIPARTLMIPIPFWFCRNPGLALPLIALQYHEVQIQVRLARFEDVLVYRRGAVVTFPGTVPTLAGVNLLVNYVYLDQDERQNFATMPHQYLIEQCYAVGDQPINVGAANKVNLPLSHPVKFIAWVAQASSVRDPGYLQWFNYTTQRHYDGMLGASIANDDNYAAYDAACRAGRSGLSGAGPGSNLCVSARIQLNSQDRFSSQPGFYFNRIVPLECFSHTPNVGINVYSFSLRPEEHQPTGQCNFSRIDHSYLVFECAAAAGTGNTYTIRAYSLNYNILRIVSGMGGILYS
jgi:hypothetical protein